MSGNIKRSLPKVVIEIVEPIVEKYYDIILLRKRENILLRIEDNEFSSFYFTLKRRENTATGARYSIEFLPSDNTMGAYITNATEEKLSFYLTEWCERIRFYRKNSILDDPILNAYQKDIKDEFYRIKLIDEDATTTPFNIYQQRLLFSFLNESQKMLEESSLEAESLEYEEIKNQISDAKVFISKETKQQVLNRISKIIAKCRKCSFEIGEKCTTAFFKALSSEVGKAAFRALVDNIE